MTDNGDFPRNAIVNVPNGLDRYDYVAPVAEESHWILDWRSQPAHMDSYESPDWRLWPHASGSNPKLYLFEGVQKLEQAPGEGGWYSQLTPEPIEVIDAWGLNYYEGTVLKYLSRWKRKNGLEDLEKASWFLERLIERERAKDERVAAGDDPKLPSDGPSGSLCGDPRCRCSRTPTDEPRDRSIEPLICFSS